MKDHWEALKELAESLEKSGASLRRFRDTIEDLPGHRKDVVNNMAKAQNLINTVRKTISIMDIEWNKALGKNNVSEENYDEMDF